MKIYLFPILMIMIFAVQAQSLMPDSDVLDDYSIDNVQYAQLMQEDKTESAFFEEKDYLDTKRAFLYSFAIPGAGQFYAKKPVKGALFLAAEAGLWLGYVILHSKGVEMRDDYEAFHEEHYDVNEFLDWLSVVSDSFTITSNLGIEQIPHNGDDWYDVDKNHDYYEMTGKYGWFLLGWDDAPEELFDRALYPDLWSHNSSRAELDGILNDTTSLNCDIYMQMRKDTNDNFIWAKYMIGAAIFNHIVSAFDAAWTAHTHNQKRNKGFSDIIYMESDVAVHNPTGTEIPELKLAIRLR